MKHTNAKRGSDGRFGGSDGPKAKRIEVWLQPQTVELLDTLCKQWNVGRGKVIDQLVTRGPVPPAAWTQVESTPEPTPSAPTPTSSTEDDPEWDVFEDISDLTEVLGYSPQECLRYLEGAIDELTEWAKTVPECKQRLTDYQAEIARLKAELSPPEPDPTPSDQVQSFVDGLNEVTRKANERAAKDKAEAQRLGVSYNDLMWATRELDIDRNYPLGADAAQAIKEKVERSQRMDNGRSIARAARRDFIKKLSDDSINELMCLINEAEASVSNQQIARYLMDGYNDLGLKPYKKICPGLWKQLQQLNPRIPSNRPLLWGIVVRLSDLGDIPTDSARLLDWCHFNTHATHSGRVADGGFNLGDAFAGRQSENQSRKLLGLPLGTPLTKKAISDAYKTLARKHHPDVGGDASKFQGINDARERLLLTVNA